MQKPRGRTERTILLAEDDPGDQELIRRSFELSGLSGRLVTVRDGRELLDYVLRTGAHAPPAVAPRPDLVLLDLNMPGVDGWQVLEALRRRADLRELPVVVLTTSDRALDVDRSYALGATSFLTKPVGLEEFTTAVQAVLRYWLAVVTLPGGSR